MITIIDYNQLCPPTIKSHNKQQRYGPEMNLLQGPTVNLTLKMVSWNWDSTRRLIMTIICVSQKLNPTILKKACPRNVLHLKTFSVVYLFSMDCFYIYIYCRNVNAEFNKLIKQLFSKIDVEHTYLCQQFWFYLDIFIFSLIKSLNCNKPLKVLGL